jgi:RNase P subunit RPR2
MKLNDKRSKHRIIALFAIAGMVFATSCEKYTFKVETIDPVTQILFQTDIQPIFTDNCITCHKGSRNPDLRTGNSYASLSSGNYITPAGETCKLYTQLNSGHPSGLSSIDRQKILLWIKQGAKNN